VQLSKSKYHNTSGDFLKSQFSWSCKTLPVDYQWKSTEYFLWLDTWHDKTYTADSAYYILSFCFL